MTDLEKAARQALEAFEYIEHNYMSLPAPATKAITSLRQALANEALDKMEENAKELGLDYDVKSDHRLMTMPAQQEPVAKKKHEPKIDLGKYAGTYGGYITPEPSEGYLEKAYRLANELRSHLSIAPAQRKPLTITEESAWDLARYVYARSNPHESPQILLSAMEIKQIIEAAHGIKGDA